MNETIYFSQNSDTAARRNLASSLGQQFGSARDVYIAAGYDKEIKVEQYKARYQRQDIASRVVDAAPDETWRNTPEILDGDSLENAVEDSQFVKDWDSLTSIDSVGIQLEDRKTIWHYLQRVDRLAGIGEFGALLIGINDGLELSEPISPGRIKGTGGFLYLSAFDQEDIEIVALDEDRASKRYGLPTSYRLSMGTNLNNKQSSLGDIEVHWSRVIHVAEDLQADEIYGVPRLRSIWNRLIDLEKILAGAGEAAWRLMYKGMILSTKDGYKIDDDNVTQEKIDEFVNGLTRFVQLEGMDVKDMGGEVVDPTGIVDLNLSFISAATGIPKRILIGSERGELASSMDEKNWSRVVATRCRNYAEPIILRPLINRLVYAGVISAPTSGKFFVKWPPFAEADPKVDSEVAFTYSQVLEKLNALTGKTVSLEDFLDTFVKPLSGKVIIDNKIESGDDTQSWEQPDDNDEEEELKEAQELVKNSLSENPVWQNFWNRGIWGDYVTQ